MLIKSFTGQVFLEILNKIPDEYMKYPLFVNWGFNLLNQYHVFMMISNAKIKRIDNKGVVGDGVYGLYDKFVLGNAQTYERPCLFFGETDAGLIEDSTPEILKRQLQSIGMKHKYLELPICMIKSCEDFSHGSFLNNVGDWLSNIKLGLGVYDLDIHGFITSDPSKVYYHRNEYLVFEIFNSEYTCGEIWYNSREYSDDEIIPIYSLDDPKYCTPYTDLSTWLSYHPQYKLVNKIEKSKIVFTSNVYVNDFSIIASQKEIRQYDN